MAGRDFRVYWLRLSWELTLIEGLLTKSSEGVIVGTETQQWLSKIKYFIFEIKYCSSTIFFFKLWIFPPRQFIEGAQPDLWASLVAQLIKNPSATQKTWAQSLGWKDPLEKGTATHSSILAWRIPWGRRVGEDWATFTFAFNLISREPQSLTLEQ